MSRHLVVFILITYFFMGCSPAITVRIDSIVDQEKKLHDKKYILYSGMKETSADDLYFREYSRYFRAILKEHGYSEVKDLQHADVAVYLSYGIDRGKDIHYTVARPVYVIEGSESIDYTETQTDTTGKTIRKKGTLHVPSRERVVAVVTEKESYTVYTAHVVLEAKEVIYGKDTRKMKTVWKVTITSTSKLDDLRRIIPVMAAASAPNLGADTGQLATIKLRENDERVVEMKLLR